jgi:hypothetical protein
MNVQKSCQHHCTYTVNDLCHRFGSLMHANGNSVVSYGNKMVNDLFDGTVGFAIDGGIKDSKLVSQDSQGT